MARMPTPITRPPASGASVKWRLPISKPTRQEMMAMIRTMRGCDRFEAAVERGVERENGDEGRGPQCRAGADGGHEQPAATGRAFGRARAREMAHADPGAEQAHRAGNQHQKLVIHEAVACRLLHEAFPAAGMLTARELSQGVTGRPGSVLSGLALRIGDRPRPSSAPQPPDLCLERSCLFVC